MNFERFKSRVAAAADAAKQFKSFDQMAAQDEYIHSPDLNVRQNRSGRRNITAADAVDRSNPLDTLENEDERNKVSSPKDDTSSRQSQDSRIASPARLSPRDNHKQFDVSSRQKTATAMPLLSVVSDIVSEKATDTKSDHPDSGSRTSRSRTPSSNFLDDTDSSDDDSVHDARTDLLKALRTGGQGNSNSQVTNAREYKKSQSNVEEGGTERHNPKRFMEDLDRRLSMPVDLEMGNSSSPAVDATDNSDTQQPLTSSFAQAQDKWGWMRSMASSRVNKILYSSSPKNSTTDSREQELTPLATNKRKKPKDSHEDFSVTNSSSLFSAEEQAELERMRLATRSTHPLTMLLDAAKQNPQFVFIAFTIVLGSAVYFYARRRGSEDGVS